MSNKSLTRDDLLPLKTRPHLTMPSETQCPIYASPMEVAGKIAAAHGEKPSVVSVPMLGSNDVESFVNEILAAQGEAHQVELNLD